MLERFLEPAPDAIACSASREGRARYFPLINLAWTFWVFVDVFFGGKVDRDDAILARWLDWGAHRVNDTA